MKAIHIALIYAFLVFVGINIGWYAWSAFVFCVFLIALADACFERWEQMNGKNNDT